ncbi:DPP IV N-terminal domain-containing protein [Thermoactinomyces mirandus]|uniref:PD40 domain-containing protein n=1 Tax=Thermoactinomyces mirandus TaxID=2756294 RepID=A0A7W1XSR2_9BACL|nr:DPP IV N-terminal domain-containing protein [Thermoactinomyces mirandus]MBA4602506.1 PD40 domain-containing protein [Thermoactinomyces mirandus]
MKKVSRKVTGVVGALILATSLSLPVYAKDEAKSILFSGGLDKPGIYVFDPDTLKTKQITSGSSVDLSPDGDLITYINNDSVYMANSNGSEPVRLTNGKFPEFDSSPRWSPDGKKIVFARSDGNIYTVDAANRKVTRLTNAEDGVYHSSPDWSPDGEKIVFHSSDKNGYADLYMMNSDGSNITQITGKNEKNSSEYAPHFSSDGKYLLFEKSKEGETDIYVMNLATKQAQNITKNFDQPVSGSIWSEDGNKVLYTVNEEKGKEEESSRFYIMNKDGSNKTLLKLQVDFATPSEWQSLNPEKEDNFLNKVKNFLFE